MIGKPPYYFQIDIIIVTVSLAECSNDVKFTYAVKDIYANLFEIQ